MNSLAFEFLLPEEETHLVVVNKGPLCSGLHHRRERVIRKGDLQVRNQSEYFRSSIVECEFDDGVDFFDEFRVSKEYS